MLSPLIQRVLAVLGTCSCSELLLQDAHACFFCVFGSCKKRQALCMQGLSSALQYAVGGNVAGSFHHRCACARCTRLILELNPSQVLLSPWPEHSLPSSSAAGIKCSPAALHHSLWLSMPRGSGTSGLEAEPHVGGIVGSGSSHGGSGPR